MIGSILVRIAFAFVLASAGMYFYSLRKDRLVYVNLARIGYQIGAGSVVLFCAYLLYLILTHQFQYTYVWNYSSTSLPTPLLVSTFYAGQEGSFSLWALYTALIGVFLMRYTAQRSYEPEVMAIWSLILVFLLLMLLVKNPFTLIWDSFPKELVHQGIIPPGTPHVLWLDRAKSVWAQYPAEGKGLNPLLQNYWMVIHPQVLFTGFSSLSVPYTFALAGLLKRDYQGWIRIAKPWTVFGTAVLGTGIILGGYWAYETLGWGGYWGWDPVENSSLIPWLVCIASIHTMMAQRRSGAFVRTNFLLSISGFIMVLYSTFLTRSGVLGETSVHSFVDPGMWAYWLLLGVIVAFGGLGFTMLLRRVHEMPKIKGDHSIYSREFALFAGALALCLAAVLITMGTSSPIITRLLHGKASAVETSYYVTTTLPIAIVISLLAGLGQLLWWKSTRRAALWRSVLFPFIGAIAFAIGLLVVGLRDVPIILFAFGSAFALLVNAIVGYRILVGQPRYAGGAIAHIGIAILFLGIVASARYDDKQTVSLEQGKPTPVLGDYVLTYVSNRQIDAERYGFTVNVRHGENEYRVMPVMRYSEETQSIIRNPDILNMYTRDFYVSPVSLESADEGNADTIVLAKGETKKIRSSMSVTFVDFDFRKDELSKMMEGGNFTIGIVLEVSKAGRKEIVKPLMKGSGGSVSYVPATTKGSGIEFSIVRMQPNNDDPAQSAVEIAVGEPTKTPSASKGETLIIEASVKPYINLVWIGTVALVIGFGITTVRRAQEAQTGY